MRVDANARPIPVAHAPASSDRAASRATPDLSPWLSLLWAVRREADAPEWAAALSGSPPSTTSAAIAPRPPEDRGCLLAGATIGVAPAAVTRLALRLLGARGSGVRPRLCPDSALALLGASIDQDDEAIAALAIALDVTSQRLAAIAPFLSMPLLQACRRAWAADVPGDWARGHCPICAAWPALAELRGPEQARRLRCSRCGGEWGTAARRCIFCDCVGPERLALMVGGAPMHHLEVCQECGGYVKAVTTAVAIRPGDVAMRDLLTLDLDLAALDAGFIRPSARAARPELDVAARRPGALLAPRPGA